MRSPHNAVESEPMPTNNDEYNEWRKTQGMGAAFCKFETLLEAYLEVQFHLKETQKRLERKILTENDRQSLYDSHCKQDITAKNLFRFLGEQAMAAMQRSRMTGN